MSYKRKTCACCRKRLDWALEDYYCAVCGTEIDARVTQGLAEMREWQQQGLSPIDILTRVLSRAAGRSVDSGDVMQTIRVVANG